MFRARALVAALASSALSINAVGKKISVLFKPENNAEDRKDGLNPIEGPNFFPLNWTRELLCHFSFTFNL